MTVTGRLRLWLLILLLLVVAAGGYWSLQFDQPAVPSAVPARVAVVPPPPPSTVAVADPASAVPATAVPPAQPASSQPAPAKPPDPAAVETSPPMPAAEMQSPMSAAGGPWRVVAGPYQTAGAVEAAAAKIRTLGYQPVIRSQTRTVALTRLRLGTYPASDLQEVLAYVRDLVPGAFALRSGEQFTVYAGTYASPRHISAISALLASEGLQVDEEPVEVQRTVSTVEFGGFSDQAAAAEAAVRASAAGIAAQVLAPR